MFNLIGKTAFVTGAAQGIGAAIARSLQKAGASVVLADIDERVHQTVAEIATETQVPEASVFDVADIEAFKDAFERVERAHDGVDILVNNAAKTVMRSVWEIDPKEWDHVLAVNLRSVFFGCQIAGTSMKKRDFGRIINLSSLAGQQPSAVAGAHYAASKAAIISVTKNFAQALASSGTTVNAISPAAVRTPVMEALGEERIQTIAEGIPVGRVGDADEVGAAAVYLSSAAAGYVTGATIDINGGRYMR